MRMTPKQYLMGVFIAIVLVCNCLAAKGKKPPKQIDPRFTAIENIVILPAVDARSGKKEKINLEDLQKSTLKGLEKKHYKVSLSDNAGTVGEITEEDLQDAKPAWIQKLGPADARWVMVVCLDDVASKMTFGSTGNAELSGYLYDKQTPTLVWKEKGIGQAGQGGLAGMMFKSTMKGEALQSALYNLLSSIPKLPKPAK
jgi:hypothetical protein